MDSPCSLTSYFSCTAAGLTSDHLSSQESLISRKCHGEEENTSGVFSTTRTSDSTAPDTEGESNSYHVEEDNDGSTKNNDSATSEATGVSMSDVSSAAGDICAEGEHGDANEQDAVMQKQESNDSGGQRADLSNDYNPQSMNGYKDEISEKPKEASEVRCHIPSSSILDTFGLNAYRLPKDTIEAIAKYRPERSEHEQSLASSDDEDIYGHRIQHSSSDVSVAEMAVSQDLSRSMQEESTLLKSEQLAESWMVYSGPASGILSLVVSEKYVWCLDYKGSLHCSSVPGVGLRWQRFEDAVQQVAVSPSGLSVTDTSYRSEIQMYLGLYHCSCGDCMCPHGSIATICYKTVALAVLRLWITSCYHFYLGNLLWKIEQKTDKAFACGKVTIKGKRHWYEALPQASSVALSDDTAWIIRTNGDLYLQTGLSVDRPCARAIKVDCPCPLSQITARNNVVWALTEQRGLLYRKELAASLRRVKSGSATWSGPIMTFVFNEPRTLQVSITDYVVFDNYTLFQTLIQATQTVATVAQAPVEKVADKLRMTFWSQQSQCQPSLLGVNSSGVWITSGKNDFHVAKGNLI
ncbi:unnamed protein product, partial [Ranitomeya imitator]